MAEDSTEAGIMVAPDVTYLGYDRRGWMVFGMSPTAPTLRQLAGSEEVTRKIVQVSLLEKRMWNSSSKPKSCGCS